MKEIVEAAVLLHDIDDVRDLPGAGRIERPQRRRACMYGNIPVSRTVQAGNNAKGINAAATRVNGSTAIIIRKRNEDRRRESPHRGRNPPLTRSHFQETKRRDVQASGSPLY